MTIDALNAAVEYFEDANTEAEEILNGCDPDLRELLIDRKEHFVIALSVLRDALQVEKASRVCTETCVFCGQPVPPKTRRGENK